jgi:hypothetical protein
MWIMSIPASWQQTNLRIFERYAVVVMYCGLIIGTVA